MITVYGSSDDLIEVEGDITEEFTYTHSGYGQPPGNLLAFSNGVLLQIDYTEHGQWMITPLKYGNFVTITPPGDPDSDNYSAVADMIVSADWVVQGSSVAYAKH